jgi:hypothetical protein
MLKDSEFRRRLIERVEALRAAALMSTDEFNARVGPPAVKTGRSLSPPMPVIRGLISRSGLSKESQQLSRLERLSCCRSRVEPTTRHSRGAREHKLHALRSFRMAVISFCR